MPFSGFVIILSPERPLDPTGWLDYVCAACLIAYYCASALAMLFVVVNTARKKKDVTILGWPGLLLILIGACMDLTSEFVTNGHLEALEAIRTYDCHPWDYWVKFLGLGAFYSGLCMCMVNSSALVYARVHKFLVGLERNAPASPLNGAVLLSNEAITALASGEKLEPDEQCEEVVLNEEVQESVEVVTLQRAPRRCRCGHCTTAWRCCWRCFCFLPISAAWSHTSPIARLRVLGFGAVAVIMGMCVLMVAGSYVPGVTAPVPGADTCYTSIFFKIVFVYALAVFLVAGWGIYLVATYTDVREFLLRKARRIWRNRICKPLLSCLEVLLLFLNNGVYLLNNPLSKGIIRHVAPGYLRGNNTFNTNPKFFLCVTRIYARHLVRFLCCCLFRKSDKDGDIALSADDELLAAYEVASDYNRTSVGTWYHELVEPNASLSKRHRPPLAGTERTSEEEDGDEDLLYCSGAGQSLTGARFSVALWSVTIGMAVRVAMNVALLVSFALGRAIYFATTEITYVIAVVAVIGDAYLCRLRGSSRAADAIAAMAGEVPENLPDAFMNHKNRVMAEFVEFVKQSAAESAARVSLGLSPRSPSQKLVSTFNWKGDSDSSSFMIKFMNDCRSYVDNKLVPIDILDSYARAINCTEGDYMGVNIERAVAFLEAYLVCMSRFKQAILEEGIGFTPSPEKDLIDRLTNSGREEDAAVAQQLRAYCTRLYDCIMEPNAVPLRSARRAVIRSARQFSMLLPSTVTEEATIVVYLLDELYWIYYVRDARHMAWLRMAKAHADAQYTREARRSERMGADEHNYYVEEDAYEFEF